MEKITRYNLQKIVEAEFIGVIDLNCYNKSIETTDRIKNLMKEFQFPDYMINNIKLYYYDPNKLYLKYKNSSLLEFTLKRQRLNYNKYIKKYNYKIEDVICNSYMMQWRFDHVLQLYSYDEMDLYTAIKEKEDCNIILQK